LPHLPDYELDSNLKVRFSYLSSYSIYLVFANVGQPCCGAECQYLDNCVLLLVCKKDAANSVREVSSQYRGWVHIFGMLALAIGVNVLLGIGEFKRQESDFIANNFKYHDLIQHDWPLYYTHYKVHMCYYLGYYLPVAQLAKWFSLESARYFALGWSVIGLFFVLLWISTFVKKNGGLLVILVIIFPNAWIIYAMIDLIGWHREVFPHYFILINDFYLVLSKFEDNWAWAPQHTLPAVLGACFVLEAFVSKKVNRLELLLMLLSTMYWSPLASIGLFPFVVILFLKDFPTLFQQAKLPELLGMTGLVMAFLPLMIYFISTEGSIVAILDLFGRLELLCGSYITPYMCWQTLVFGIV
jgi:hypothetical protein